MNWTSCIRSRKTTTTTTKKSGKVGKHQQTGESTYHFTNTICQLTNNSLAHKKYTIWSNLECSAINVQPLPPPPATKKKKKKVRKNGVTDLQTDAWQAEQSGSQGLIGCAELRCFSVSQLLYHGPPSPQLWPDFQVEAEHTITNSSVILKKCDTFILKIVLRLYTCTDTFWGA